MGQFSAKFTEGTSAYPRGKKCVETNIRNGDATGLARNGFGQYYTDTQGLIGCESKKVSPIPGSDVMQWKPSKRSLAAPGTDHYIKPEGRRGTEPAPGRAVNIREKRHIRQVESKEEVTDRPVGPMTVYRENGLRAAEQPAREVDITLEMQRKVPIRSVLEMRNGIGVAVHGDKGYRHPEYSNRFHQMGELVIGSSFSRGHYKKTLPRNATSVQLVEVQRKEGAMTFEERQQRDEMVEAQTEVKELTRNWERSVLKTTEAAKYDEPSDSEDEAAQ
jgi:hypothetical protein